MADFNINGSGQVDLRTTDLSAFDGFLFATSGNTTILITGAQANAVNTSATPSATGSGFRDTIEVHVDPGTSVSLANWVFTTWDQTRDRISLLDQGGNETITGSGVADTITVSAGSDVVNGGAGDDILVLNYALDNGSFSMAGGNTQFTDFSNTSVTFSGIERFDLLLGSGSDNVLTGAGSDTLRGGAGNDTLNSGAGAAVIDGGEGADVWAADFTGDGSAKTVNLTLTGVQNAGGGSTYVNVERLNFLGGAGKDRITTRTDNANDGLNDTVNGGGGNDTITVGGGTDQIIGGDGNDLLIVDYSTDNGNFSMSGGNSSITDFSNTSVSFSLVERFDLRLGSGGDNVLTGANDDSLSGGAGNDTLNSAAGAAVIDGGDGADLWSADFSGDGTAKAINLNLAGVQIAGNGSTYVNVERLGITGGNGNDVFSTRTDNANDGLNDTVNGGGGSDTITVGGGSDVVNGGDGNNDLLVVDYTTDTGSFSMFGGDTGITDFSNTTVTFQNVERFDLRLGKGSDNVLTFAGDDSLAGGGGNDTLNAGSGAAVIDGGNGKDLWVADFAADNSAKVIDLNLGGVQLAGNGTTYESVERLNITGGAGNDLFASLTGNANDGLGDTINGGLGNDTIAVGGGSDTVIGGDGNDLLIVDYSTDSGNFSMFNANTGITDFSNTGVTFTGIEQFNVALGTGNDNIITGAGDDTLNGGGGNDTLNSAAGEAVIDGGNGGNDLWVSDFSADSTARAINLNTSGIQSAGGTSTFQRIERVNFSGGSGKDEITTRTGNPNDGLSDTVNGGSGNDTITVGGGTDVVNGGDGNDLLVIDYANDTFGFSMAGGNTNITDFSNTGVTFSGIERFNLRLGSAADTVLTFAGNDTLRGNGGNDVLTGGGGSDRFEFMTLADSGAAIGNTDRITDFDVAGDRLDLSAIDAVTGGTDNAFDFIEGTAFSAAGQARTFVDAGNTYVALTTDGVTTAMLIRLDGLVTLDDSDFIL